MTQDDKTPDGLKQAFAWGDACVFAVRYHFVDESRVAELASLERAVAKKLDNETLVTPADFVGVNGPASLANAIYFAGLCSPRLAVEFAYATARRWGDLAHAEVRPAISVVRDWLDAPTVSNFPADGLFDARRKALSIVEGMDEGCGRGAAYASAAVESAVTAAETASISWADPGWAVYYAGLATARAIAAAEAVGARDAEIEAQCADLERIYGRKCWPRRRD